MSLIKYHDREWFGAFDEWNRAMRQMLGGNPYHQPTPAGNFRVDTYSDDQGYHLVAEMPGVAKSDLEVKVHNEVLTIKAVRKVVVGEEENSLNFTRSINIGNDVDASKISAKLEYGMLVVDLPKTEESHPKTISIH